MKKKKGASQNFPNNGDMSATLNGGNSPTLPKEQNNNSNFGVIYGEKIAARDGHSAEISQDGQMFVFGGDRHHMPFNDLYTIRL